MPTDELAELHFPDRSVKSVTTRASRLGLHKAARFNRTGKPWSPDELAALQAYYEEHGGYWLHENHLPHRSVPAIMAKAWHLGLHAGSDRWTEAENDVIRTNYDKMPAKQLAKLLPGRTVLAVRNQIGTLGLKLPVSPESTIHGATIANGGLHNTDVAKHEKTEPAKNNKTTGIRGVCYCKHSKKYIAYSSFKGKSTNVYCDTLEEAVRTRQAMEAAIKPALNEIAKEGAARADEYMKSLYERAET